MGWLWQSLEPIVATTVEFCETSKQIWDSIAYSFLHQSDVSRVYDCMSRFLLLSNLVDHSLSITADSMGSVVTTSTFHYRLGPTEAALGGVYGCFFAHWFRFQFAWLQGLDFGQRDFIFSSQCLFSLIMIFFGTQFQYFWLYSFDWCFLCFGLWSGTTLSVSRGNFGPRGSQTSSRGSSSCDSGSYRGSRGGRGPASRGDWKCDYCGSIGHTEPWCCKSMASLIM